MTTPKRIQRRRIKDWRKPEGAIMVDRGTSMGNPFVVGFPGVPDNATAVQLYRDFMDRYRQYFPISDLTGHDLGCYCKPDQPCHADVLLELANP